MNEEKNKLKVAMICHFSNEMVRNKLLLSDFAIVNFFRKLLHLDPYIYGDYAPWINAIIYQSEKLNDKIELHVIAPHLGMMKTNECFDVNGIKYHFFKSKPSPLIVYLDILLFEAKLVHYRSNGIMVSNWIKSINPDIVVLVGAENPYYSSTALRIKNIPLFVLCQTVYNNPEFKKTHPKVLYNKRAAIEKRILNSTCYVGALNEKQNKLLRENGYNGFVFDFHWPNNPPFVAATCMNIRFDFINFANGMSSEKGYHDSIKALAKIKNKYPNVKLALVDKGPDTVRLELQQLIKTFDLQDNVTFIPFFEKKAELMQFLHCVRFAVLPSKVDHVSGTMHQAMGQGLPTVVYETTGTPALNKEKNCVLIAKKGDVDDLANKMMLLMDNEQLAKTLSKNSVEFMKEYRESNESRMQQLIAEFKAIINNYHFNISIPSDYLYE